MQKIIYFIKYNNATTIILAVILILGGGALAAGPEAIGQKETTVQGIDNTALLAADLDRLDLDFKIENLEQDEKYYYATYSYLDLVQRDGAWQYQLSQRTQKISQKIKEDLGAYLAKFLAKHYQARRRELRREKALAESQGEQKRVEVTEYSGLIGRALDLAAKVFPGYEPVVKRELPAPENFALPILETPADLSALAPTPADNLTRIYNEYVAEHPEIFNLPAEPIDNAASSSPADSTDSPLADSTDSPLADSTDSPPADSTPSTNSEQDSSPPAAEPTATPAPDPTATPIIPEPASVDIIELPVPPSASSGQAAPEPVVTPETAPLEPAPVQ